MFITATHELTSNLSHRALLAVELEEISEELSAWKLELAKLEAPKSYKDGYIAYESRYSQDKDYYGSTRSLNEKRNAKRARHARSRIEYLTDRFSTVSARISILDNLIASIAEEETPTKSENELMADLEEFLFS